MLYSRKAIFFKVKYFADKVSRRGFIPLKGFLFKLSFKLRSLKLRRKLLKKIFIKRITKNFSFSTRGRKRRKRFKVHKIKKNKQFAVVSKKRFKVVARRKKVRLTGKKHIKTKVQPRRRARLKKKLKKIIRYDFEGSGLKPWTTLLSKSLWSSWWKRATKHSVYTKQQGYIPFDERFDQELRQRVFSYRKKAILAYRNVL